MLDNLFDDDEHNELTGSHVNCSTEINSNQVKNYLIGFIISLLVFLAVIYAWRCTKLFSKFKAKKKVNKRFLQKNISPLPNAYSTGGGKHLNSRMKGLSKYFSKRHSLGPSSIQNRTTNFITSSQQLSDEFNLASRNYSWGKHIDPRSAAAYFYSAKRRIDLNIPNKIK